ncbi:MAG: hypothetical protein AB7O32_12480 [Vicinamibacterales bacterium]
MTLDRAPTRLALAATVLACLVPIVWPGDIPFINDEPLLIANAVRANGESRLASMGLQGTFGFAYGPVPTWIYQALMGVTDNLIVVAALHAVILSAATAGALWWLGRSLDLPAWFVPVPLLSPYFWFYSRVLWDNPVLLPLGALAVAGYAAFLKRGSPAGLRASWAALLLIPLVHLMGLALAAPLAAHMAAFNARALWRHKWSLAIVSIAVVAASAPYCLYLLGPRPDTPPGGGGAEGWLFPLFGGRLLSATGLAYFYGAAPVAGPLFAVTSAVTMLAYVLVWAGLGLALAGCLMGGRPRRWSPRAHVGAVAVAALGCQSVIDGISGRFQHPHYQNGTWIVFVLLAWLAIDALASRAGWPRRGAVLLTGVLAASLLISVAALALDLHRHGGTREVYGPTLANQLRVARALAGYDPSSDLQIRVSMWERFPHAPAILRDLSRPRLARLPRRDLLVRYASGDTASGFIELVER